MSVNTNGALKISRSYLKTVDAYGGKGEIAQDAKKLAIQWAIVQGIKNGLNADSQPYDLVEYANTTANPVLDALADAGFKIVRAARR